VPALRVLVLHNRYRSDRPSGENVVVDLEIDLLREAGVDVVEYQRSSDEIAGYSPRQRVALATRPIYAKDSVTAVAQLIKDHRPDVVHLHNPYPLLSPAVLRVAHRLGVATVLTAHNYRLVCAKGTFFRDGQRCHDCEDKVLPWPAVAHACYRGSRAQSMVLGTALVVHRRTWRGADRFIALTPAMADFLTRSGAPADRVVVKPNTVRDPGPAQSGDRKDFVFAGRLSRDKGVDLLMEAWDQHAVGSLGTLHIVGDGELRQSVAAFAARRADVKHHGIRDRGEIQQLLSTAAVAVVPSRWDEICPMIVLEALSHGCPVLATANGGLPYLVGGGGWVVNAGVSAFSAGLTLAARESAVRTTDARARYVDTFAPEPTIATLVEAYESARAVGAT
jgi:glycosyltransferase involved in cell wall biosynthesis